MNPKIAVALSTIFTMHGGIPRFNQMLCLAFDQLADERGYEIDVLSQDDTPEDYAAAGAPWKRARFVDGGDRRRLALKSLDICRRGHPDLFLVGLLGMAPLGLACLPFLGRGFGFVAHGTDAWNEPRLSRRFSARRACFAFAVSRHTGRSLVESTGIASEAVRWLPNTLAPEFEAAPADPVASVGEHELEILTVSRLDPREDAKGVDVTIEVFARIAERFPRARYRIIGRGDDKPRLRALAETLGVAGRIDFEEGLSDDDLAEAYRRCSVFVLPSGQEGFGIVFLEAMRFSRPCIGGNAGGTPEVIVDGETGVLVPFGDRDALENELATLLGDPALRDRMGRAGRERLDSEFVFARFRKRLGDHIEELLGH